LVVEHPGTTQIVIHCDKVICISVPSRDNQWVTPSMLASAWWPDDLAIPDGSPMEQLMAVWSLVSERVSYVQDSDREGFTDCWLTPSSTWSDGEGDCEDHAILMVAMLAKLGIRAWLTWGKLDGEGHAWVEVEIENKLFLIEATAKSPLPEQLPLGKVCTTSAPIA
jgi:transglutaminase-like putative cysteine protease